MAQTTQSDPAKKSTAAPPATPTALQTGMHALRNVGQRLGFGAQPATTNAAGAQKPRSKIWQFVFGMIIFVVGSQLAAYVLFFLNAQFNLGLNNTELIPAGVPLIGGMTPFLLLYLLFVILLWVVLYRFNIIPKDPFGAKAAAEARSRERASVSTGAHRTRSERRRASTATTTKASVKAQPEARRVATVSHGDDASDEAYERMKAAQRARKRRAAKR